MSVFVCLFVCLQAGHKFKNKIELFIKQENTYLNNKLENWKIVKNMKACKNENSSDYLDFFES